MLRDTGYQCDERKFCDTNVRSEEEGVNVDLKEGVHLCLTDALYRKNVCHSGGFVLATTFGMKFLRSMLTIEIIQGFCTIGLLCKI